MLTLTQASISARKFIRYFIYTIIAVIILRFVWIGVVNIYLKVFPPKLPPPTVAFGKLPPIPFPEREIAQIKFTLETVDGNLPPLGEQTKVYYMPKVASNLLSLDYAKEVAQDLGYDYANPEQINEAIYKFKNPNTPSTLEYDIVNNSFSLSYDLILDPSPLTGKLVSNESAFSSVISFLKSASLLAPDLSQDNATFQYLKAREGKLVDAISLSDSNLIRVNLNRKTYNDLPVVSRTSKWSNVWFLVSGIRERGRSIISGEYHYFPVDETQFATYPIKPVSEAWNDLISNKYYPAYLSQIADGDEIKIRNVYLAYYDAGIYTKFMQPVYVFEGDKEFSGYVPAVTNEYYEENQGQ